MNDQALDVLNVLLHSSLDVLLRVACNSHSVANNKESVVVGASSSDGESVDSEDGIGEKVDKRHSSFSVDSNLSFEFAETQEPCITYKFEYS